MYLGISAFTLANCTQADQLRLWLGLIVGVLPFLLSATEHFGWFHLTAHGYEIGLLFMVFIFAIFIIELFSNSSKPFENISSVLTGMVYTGFPIALLPFIAFDQGEYTPKYVISLLLIIWLNDTGAYFVGSRHGKTPLFPRISPAKTWEGSIGGLVTAILLAGILSIFIRDLSLVDWIMLATVTVIVGSIGDLVESMLKRSLTIKDSGTLLPGHGGFLDRFDGFLFAVPFYVLSLHWILGN